MTLLFPVDGGNRRDQTKAVKVETLTCDRGHGDDVSDLSTQHSGSDVPQTPRMLTMTGDLNAQIGLWDFESVGLAPCPAPTIQWAEVFCAAF